MRITVTIDQPTGDFQDRLLALLAEHAAATGLIFNSEIPAIEAEKEKDKSPEPEEPEEPETGNS